MIYKACALMIYNSFGIDDIHGFAVIWMRLFNALKKILKTLDKPHSL